MTLAMKVLAKDQIDRTHFTKLTPYAAKDEDLGLVKLGEVDPERPWLFPHPDRQHPEHDSLYIDRSYWEIISE